MLNAFSGRINRRTYIAGNMLAIAALLAAVAVIIIPVAILDIAFGDRPGGSIISVFYFLAAVPAIVYYFYFSVLMVRRLHDIGYPGILVLTIFTVLFIVGRLLDFNLINFVLFAAFLFLCLKPGQSEKNAFGPKPRNKFSKNKLKVHLDSKG